MKRLAIKMPLVALAASAMLLFSQASVCLASEPENTFPETGIEGMEAYDSFQTVGKVILFLLLIILLFFLLIRFLARKNKFSMFGRSIRSLGGVPLGQNKSIQIVEIGRSLYVVGVGENIQLLEKINHPDEVAELIEILTEPRADAPGLISLGKWLQRFQPGAKKEIEEEVEITSSFQQVFHDKLQRVKGRNKRVEEWLSDQKQTDRLNDK